MVAALVAAALAVTAGGCRLPTFTTGASATFSSAQNDDRLRPDFDTRSYAYQNGNVADAVFTDLPPEAFGSPEALARASGQIVHVHMFIRPRPGTTPIEESAVSCTVRYIVLAEGRAGVYAGGGFILPNGEPDGRTLIARLPEATLALVGKTDGFDDRIGRGSLRMVFAVEHGPETVARVLRAADRLAIAVTPEPGRTLDDLMMGRAFADADAPPPEPATP